MKKSYDFRIMLRKEPEGGYTAFVPSLPGCVTYGDTIDEAIEMTRKLLNSTSRVSLNIMNPCHLRKKSLNIISR
ncbi:MAG: type II toxin-antitoxin system HicB family antitoxin [Methanogenium sp.]